ncbi:hypothetical protein SAY86_012114 [Trapa natans]|uniref:Hexosyltransferase n=1 Tax=Trapa natans TaxID=22666 RepID=A0AAN7RAC4_TRANT|nr:hypothetical protein SAY86_012114 [Trapa natans]
MKGGGAGAGKRRWKCLVIAIFGLVILSMLVPFGFLFGRFRSSTVAVLVTEQQTSQPNRLWSFDRQVNVDEDDHSDAKKDRSEVDHAKELVDKFAPAISKDAPGNIFPGGKNHTIDAAVKDKQPELVFSVPSPVLLPSVPSPNGRKVYHGPGKNNRPNKTLSTDNDKSCEMTFGSYCLWRQEHKKAIKDDMVKKLKDRLFVARAYFPSVAKLPDQEKLSHELRLNIQEFERILSESSRDADLPPLIEMKLQKMEAAIAKSQAVKLDCNNVNKKLAQILDLTEDEANFHTRQSAFLYQLAVQTMPKSLHCLSLRLTVEYFSSYPPGLESSLSNKFSDPAFHHFVMLSNNVLASSVVINSTVMNARESQSLVFHVLTNDENYFAMKLWFLRNEYKGAAVQVLNVEHLDMDFQDKASLLSFSLSQEFRISFHNTNDQSYLDMRTEYISLFSSLHYLLPEIFQNLGKIIVLDDDIVVQQDLSTLWNLDMEGKVIAAQMFCSVRLGQLWHYTGENGSSRNSCSWMSGFNIIDLRRWRELQLTETYQRLLQEVRKILSNDVVLSLEPLSYCFLFARLLSCYLFS